MKDYKVKPFGLEIIEKTREYLMYVEHHLLCVSRAFNIVTHVMKDNAVIYDDSQWHALRHEVERHDLSKFTAMEFCQYRRWVKPTDREKESGATELAKAEFDTACNHHYAVNGHHWQNWTNRVYGHPHEQGIHFFHMLVDWVAMEIACGRLSPRAYYERNKETFKFPEWAEKLTLALCEVLEANQEELLEASKPQAANGQ